METQFNWRECPPTDHNGSNNATMKNPSLPLPINGEPVWLELLCTSLKEDTMRSQTTGDPRSINSWTGEPMWESTFLLTITSWTPETPMTEATPMPLNSGITWVRLTDIKTTFSLKSATNLMELAGMKSNNMPTELSQSSETMTPTPSLLLEPLPGHKILMLLTPSPITTSCTPSTTMPQLTKWETWIDKWLPN